MTEEYYRKNSSIDIKNVAPTLKEEGKYTKRELRNHIKRIKYKYS